ncbi:Type 1 glutamine amidotransferase-like domain-containing protein [Vagococcus silagei]|uniref:Peptidase n=1 Tax=Vagococcus silagei TaxID=2508885 RepID=A0A4S3B2Y5_9ENTE|nr:Type 1 glutamine amidotransferase-like domain-containing protein [Vagococcus silagei]THB60090.1 peptidase [Vagococcus silagei]
MKNLFLASSFADSYQQLTYALKDQKIAFFDTASLVEEYTDYKDDTLIILSELKADVMVVDLESATLKEDLASVDIIFIAGGNTFYLLQELRRSGADLLILDHISQGKRYIGESAGSIIMGPDIDFIKYMDEPEKASHLESTLGFNVIDVYPLPHVNNDYLNDAVEEILRVYQDRLAFHLLTDRDVLVVEE